MRGIGRIALALGLVACDGGNTVEHDGRHALCRFEIGLADAMDAARDAQAGTVIEAEIEVEGSDPIYDVELVSPTEVAEVTVDPETGDVDVDVEGVPDDRERSDADAIAAAPTSLADAIATAEAEVDGCAVSIGLIDAELIGVVVQTDEEAVGVAIRLADGMVMEVTAAQTDDD